MRAELEEIALVEDYLEGRLSGQGLSEFEQRMTLEPDFKNVVDMQRVVVEAVIRAGRSKISADLNNAYELTRPQPGFLWNSATGYLLGATIVGSLALGAYFISSFVVEENEPVKTEEPAKTDNTSIKVVNKEAGELNLEIISDNEEGYYSFSAGKLTLYGAFNKEDIYVEEIFGSGEYYLHYQDQHYLLKEGAEKDILELETDPDILELFE